MRKLLLTISCFILLVAQAQEVSWGELGKSINRPVQILPVNGKSFYAISSRGNLYASTGSYVARYDNFMKVVEEETTGINYLVLNGVPVTIHSFGNGTSKTAVLTQVGENCLPVSRKDLFTYTIPEDAEEFVSVILQSKNKEFFSFEYSYGGKKGADTKIGYKVLNKELEVISEGEYTAPEPGTYGEVSARHLSDNGEYFAVVKIRNLTEKGRMNERAEVNKCLLYHLRPGGSEEVRLDLDDKKITDVAISTHEDLVTVTGLYSHDGKGAVGLFYFQLNEDRTEVSDKGFSEFGKEFIASTLIGREKKQDDADADLDHYEFRELMTLPDGSLVAILEQYSVNQITTHDDRGMPSTNYYYRYGVILAYRISNTGEFMWLKSFPKYQSTKNDFGYYSSIASYVSHDKMILFFNDNIKNYDEAGTFTGDEELHRASFTGKSNCLTKLEIDVDSGNSKRVIFSGREEAEAIAVPKLFVSNYENEQLFLVMLLGTKQKFGILDLGE